MEGLVTTNAQTAISGKDPKRGTSILRSISKNLEF